jgi:tetraacyldisaccharide 4'-kinase
MAANSFFRALLWLPAQIFALVLHLRHWAYDHGLLRRYRISVPVVSVGNISVGGSGKSPMTLYLATEFSKSGYRVGIVSRGYGRRSRSQVVVSKGAGPLVAVDQAGDEPQMMARQSRNIAIVVDRDRVAGARCLAEQLGCNLIIADDAMQHRRLHRDVDVVLWNNNGGRGALQLLPAGRLRELKRRLRRPAILVLSKATSPEDKKRWPQLLALRPFNAVFAYRLTAPRHIHDQTPLATGTGKRIIAFAGIADPESLFRYLRDTYPDEKWHFIPLNDHFSYAKAAFAKRVGGDPEKDIYVTTAKDWVKVDAFSLRQLYVVDVVPEQLDGVALTRQIADQLARD